MIRVWINWILKAWTPWSGRYVKKMLAVSQHCQMQDLTRLENLTLAWLWLGKRLLQLHLCVGKNIHMLRWTKYCWCVAWWQIKMISAQFMCGSIGIRWHENTTVLWKRKIWYRTLPERSARWRCWWKILKKGGRNYWKAVASIFKILWHIGYLLDDVWKW